MAATPKYGLGHPLEARMPDHRPLRPSDPTQLGSYQLVGRLGEGGQGVVYLGRTASGTPVAVKALHPTHATNDQARRRFLREAAVARRVAPFCTARVLAAGATDGQLYLVSEFIDGLSLHRLVSDGGPLDGGALYRLAVGSAAALAAIHRAGVVHRDFKPSNVILGTGGPRVVDFGIARALDASTTLSSGVFGTPAFMSPEQVSGAAVGPASDVFSWAATIVFAATGRLPFGQDGIPAVLHRILHHHPNLSAVPRSLRVLIIRCLRKDPDRRPDAAEVLLALLEHQGLLADRPVLAGDGSQDLALLRTGAAVATPPMRQQADRTAPGDLAGDRSTELAGDQSTELVSHHRITTVPAPRAHQPDHGPGWITAGLRSVRRRHRWSAWPVLGALAVLALVAIPSVFSWWDRGPDPGRPAVDATGPATAGPPPAAAPVEQPDRFGSQLWQITVNDSRVDAMAYGTPAGRPVVVAGGAFGDQSLRVLGLDDAGWAVAPLIAERPGADLFNSLPFGASWSHGDGPYAVAVTELDGRPVAVAADRTETRVRLWDLATGEQFGEILPRSNWQAIAAGHLDGRPIAVSGNRSGEVQVWNLATGQQLGEPFTGHTSAISSVALGTLGDRPIAVSASYDRTLRVWDLATGQQVGQPLTGHEASVEGVAVAERYDRTVAVSGGSDQTVRVWDLATGEQLGEPFTGHRAAVASVAVGTLDGRPIVVSGGGRDDPTLRVWDLATGEQLGEPFTGHEDSVRHVVIAETRDGPIAVSGSFDGTVRAWRLQPLSGR